MRKICRILACMVFPMIVVAGLIAAIAVPLSKIDAPNRPVQGPEIEYAGAARDTGAASADKSKKGGAIFLEPNTKYTMTGGTISGKKNTYGGAVFISSGATFIMTSGTISGCSATYGGGIYVAAGGTCTIEAGTITGCTANYGPAIYVEVGGTLSLSPSANVDENDVLQDYDLKIGPEVVLGRATGTTKLKTIEFGTYPKTYVGDSMNATLESWYVGKSSVKTYTCRQSTWTAYTYTDGNIYARGSALRGDSYSVYKDGTAATTGKMTWFKVEPITWYILNYDAWSSGQEDLELYSELVIAGDIYFNASTSDGNSWASSYIRNWCNNTFFKEAFDATEQAMIKDTKVGNNVTDNYDKATSDSSGTATTDKIYLKSYYEMGVSPFTSDDLRKASPSDFAIGNKTCCSPSGSSYATAYRTDRTGFYGLRSAGSGASYACYVSTLGFRANAINVYGSATGVRPALHLAL